MSQSSYDAVPYPSYAFLQSHPSNLSVLAHLFGMRPPPPRSARVLELGCAAGGNLLPMAAALPDATFVGIDLSPRQIADGQHRIAELGLSNVTLEVRDILADTSGLGSFDYILAHGVWSWVPQGVQERIFSLCREHLSPEGVAYISYNTLPGWELHGVAREMMLYFAEDEEEPLSRVARGRAMLEFLARSVPSEQVAYQGMLSQLVSSLEQHDDAYVLHEFLEEHNEPVRFVDFMDRAHAHGLQYLGESGLTAMLDHYFAPATHAHLRSLSTSIFELEQYMDFLRNRTFRQTCLVHREVKLQRNLTLASLSGLHAASKATLTEGEGDAGPTWASPNGNVEVSLTDPAAAALARRLTAAWPASVPVDEAVHHAIRDVWPDGLPDAQANHARAALHSALLSSFTLQLAELSTEPAISQPLSPTPRAWPYARALAATSARVTTPRHENVDLEDFDLRLLRLLDGERDLPELTAALRADAARVQQLTGAEHPDGAVDAARVRSRLTQFATWGLLA